MKIKKTCISFISIRFVIAELLPFSTYIGLGLSVRYVCTRSRTVRERILKFGMWDEYEN